jgi:hypothetical protein
LTLLAISRWIVLDEMLNICCVYLGQIAETAGGPIHALLSAHEWGTNAASPARKANRNTLHPLIANDAMDR